MPTHRATVLIDRPVEDVFGYMNDVSREHEWQPKLIEAEQSPPGRATVGTHRRYVSDFMGRRVENTYVIREYEPDRRVVLEATEESALSVRTEIEWEPVGGGTRVTMSLEGTPRGALRLIPGRLLEKTFTTEVENALERVKRGLET